MRRAPPARSFTGAGAPVPVFAAPPPLLLSLPPHAASSPLALSAAPPTAALRRASRRVMSWSQPGVGSLLILVLLLVDTRRRNRVRSRGT
jgi:hypothetical protein